MEKLLNHYDKEYMKISMLKHEETFREQVYELHRLYRIQKILMKDVAKNKAHPRQCLDLERPAEEFNTPGNCRVSEVEDDPAVLELTLAPSSYYRRKSKAADQALKSDSGLSFSSSSTGSTNIKGTRSSTTNGELFSQQKRSLDLPVSSNQDRLNSPPWLFQALSLNMT